MQKTSSTTWLLRVSLPPLRSTAQSIAAMLLRLAVEVLKLIAKGCSNKVVADRLNISEDTVKGHVRNILSELKANDRTHAAKIALHRGFVET